MVMKYLSRYLLLCISLAAIFPGTTFAHSFNIVFMAPISEPAGQSALDGFLLATREQDSHAFEESDGHLGGLDSYLFKIDSVSGKPKDPARLENVLTEFKPLFAVSMVTDKGVRNLLEKHRVVLVVPASGKDSVVGTASTESITTMDDASFYDLFKNSYGYPPDSHSTYGYLVARVITRVIRNSSERDRSNPDSLEKMVKRALESTIR